MDKKEYIERGALVESLKKQYGEELGWQCTVNMSDVEMMIDDAPAADVVEVVRCKDCKHYHRYTDRHTNEPSRWGRCTSISMDIDLMANDYCCYGERKEQT